MMIEEASKAAQESQVRTQVTNLGRSLSDLENEITNLSGRLENVRTGLKKVEDTRPDSPLDLCPLANDIAQEVFRIKEAKENLVDIHSTLEN